MTCPRRPRERGFTLIEISLVMAMAALLVLGLVTFYISSQSTWIDGSSQAITQRDATLLAESICDSVRRCVAASVSSVPDPQHQTLVLYYPDKLTQYLSFYCAPDSLVHMGRGPGNADAGPVVLSRVNRLQFTAQDTTAVLVDMIELRSVTGEHVHLSSAAVLYNRP